MIVDSSALIAILRQEDDAQLFSEALMRAGIKLLAAPIYVETCMVYCGRKGEEGLPHVDRLVRESGIEIRAFSSDAASIAVEAFFRYGKGIHRAKLNFGDCISYAMAKIESMPLLFKGDDFRLTDVEAAI
ncbi:MAG: type II toxin-antitoxin system VapC family toxin [Aestuariivirga sp.]